VNGRVLRLLADYFRRTLGLWLLFALAVLLQTTVFWATNVQRTPLLGVVIASLCHFAAFESPYAILRTLPLQRADVALFRWWASIGAPGLIFCAATIVSGRANADNGWPRPPDSSIALSILAGLAVLGWLTALPLPVLRSEGRGRSWFAVVWGVLVVAALYGLPFHALPRVVLTTLVVSGVVLCAVSFERARRGQATRLTLPDMSGWTGGSFQRRSAQARSQRAGKLRGWSVLAAEVARSTVLLSIFALVGAATMRAIFFRPAYSAPAGALVCVFVSAVMVATCFLTRRWLHAVSLLRILPVGERQLALILHIVLVMPALVACLVAMGARQISPHLGLAIPWYVLIALPGSPLTLVPWQKVQASAPVPNALQQWAPIIQQGTWPLWVGPLGFFSGPGPMHPWLVGCFVLLAISLSIAGYWALLVAVRSPAQLESNGGPLGAAA
jgi:hypothetical protein